MTLRCVSVNRGGSSSTRGRYSYRLRAYPSQADLRHDHDVADAKLRQRVVREEAQIVRARRNRRRHGHVDAAAGCFCCIGIEDPDPVVRAHEAEPKPVVGRRVGDPMLRNDECAALRDNSRRRLNGGTGNGCQSIADGESGEALLANRLNSYAPGANGPGVIDALPVSCPISICSWEPASTRSGRRPSSTRRRSRAPLRPRPQRLPATALGRRTPHQHSRRHPDRRVCRASRAPVPRVVERRRLLDPNRCGHRHSAIGFQEAVDFSLQMPLCS